MRRSGRSMNRKGRDRGAEMRLTEGYSSSDLTSLAKDAALGPIRGEIIKDPTTRF